MSTRKERRERSKTWRGGVCMNCGEKGPHYVPPSWGDPGFYSCKKKEEAREGTQEAG